MKKKLKVDNIIKEDLVNAEIVIALVGAVGVEYKQVIRILTDRLINNFNYSCEEIRISKEVMDLLPDAPKSSSKPNQYERIMSSMDFGNMSRKKYEDNSLMALGATRVISEKRAKNEGNKRRAYIINSIKHPDEVKLLREVYGHGFYLIGVYSDLENRKRYLNEELSINKNDCDILISRDENDVNGHGQHTSDTYHLSDFFVQIDHDLQKLKASIFRFLDILFGKPTVTPLFEEFAMFMAFTSSLRSADLSRQVGAVIAKDNDIIATGTNDCPKFGGGLYWPYYNGKEYTDFPDGRDYTREFDSNAKEKQLIIDEIIEKAKDKNIDEKNLTEILKLSPLKDLIEFGRILHAEMEALMVCARNNISSKNAELYCTTFPCHNCAKHIIAAGISRVVYIEPYPKSKALEFHKESIKVGMKTKKNEEVTTFEAFIGVGPRKFFDLFSMNLGSGRAIKRKEKDGQIVKWEPKTTMPKVQLFPISYIDREKNATEKFSKIISK